MERITTKEARERTDKVNADEAELALTQIYKEIKDATEPKCGNSFVTLDFGKKFRHHKIWRKIKEELEKDGYTVDYNDVLWKRQLVGETLFKLAHSLIKTHKPMQ